MRKWIHVLALMTVSSYALADEVVPSQPPLDKITFQVSSRQWVTTNTAVVNVSINVTLNDANLVKARTEIMSSLNKIAQGDWHITEFDRSQDNSGLEKLFVQAQVRVDQSALTSIYQNAKSVSVPGSKYEINGVDFKPSLEEIQTVRAKVREQLYQQVNDEVGRINKVYPLQKYSVSQLVFMEGNVTPQARDYQAKMNAVALAGAPAPEPIAVSNEIVLTAMVDVASNRK